MPSVSFIIPSHNRAAELTQTLEALRAQTRDDWEAIVIDDHSTDGALDVARGFAERDARFKLLELPDPHRGASTGRNFALPHATGEFVIFLDGDDLIAPTCVEYRVAHMQANPALDFAVWRCQIFRKTPGDTPVIFNVDTGSDDLDRYLSFDVPWQTMQPTWRRASLQKLKLPREAGPLQWDGTPPPQLWDESVLSGQDWEFHIRALAIGLRYERVDAIDCFWRMAGPDRDSIGKQSFTKQHARARPTVVRKMHDFLIQHGQFTPRRKQAFAALYFQAADNLAKRVSRKEGRSIWIDARGLGLVDSRQWKQADRYLFLQRWPALAARKRKQIEREWPREMLPRGGKYFCMAPIPGHTPRVSVVVSAYNNAAYVQEAIQSIRDQTFRDFELIVIDDGSTDETGTILRDLADRDCRIRLVQRENKGLTVSLNEGLALARGEFVARMDADDVADPERFEKQVAFLDANPDHVAVGSRVELIDPFGVPIDRPDEHRLVHDEIDAALMRGSGWALVHPVTTFRREALTRVGNYREQYNNVEDLDLFLRLAEVGKLANLPDVLLKYRQHLGSVNHQKFQRQRELKLHVLAEAYQRRGVPMPASFEFNDRQHVDVNEQHRFWGWRALKVGRPDAARRHAVCALKAKPSSWASWKLLRSALRGH